VTGAGSDIGCAIAERLARNGYSLVLIDIDRAALDAASTRAPESQAFVCDVTDEAAVRDMAVQALQDAPGKAQVLVNNAAVVVRQPLLETSLSEWRRVFEVNVHGAFVCTKGARTTSAGGGPRGDRERRLDDGDGDDRAGHVGVCGEQGRAAGADVGDGDRGRCVG